jgi:hypothetical protein
MSPRKPATFCATTETERALVEATPQRALFAFAKDQKGTTMATRAQNRANKANAQQSTGPKTNAGKQASKYNRTRHGLAGKQVVIHCEDAAAYEALRIDLIDSYQPANVAETALVDEIAQNYWRLQRARAIEAETFNVHCHGADPIIGYESAAPKFETIRRYMASIERAYHRAMTQLHLEQSTRRKREKEEAPAQSRVVYSETTTGYVMTTAEQRRQSELQKQLLPGHTPQPSSTPPACPTSTVDGHAPPDVH